MTKKVFSVEKYKECLKKDGIYTKSLINIFCKTWANKCDGLTEEEMNDLGYLYNDEWMIEKD